MPSTLSMLKHHPLGFSFGETRLALPLHLSLLFLSKDHRNMQAIKSPESLETCFQESKNHRQHSNSKFVICLNNSNEMSDFNC